MRRPRLVIAAPAPHRAPHRRAAAVSMAAATLLLAGCGDDSDDPEVEAGETPTTAAGCEAPMPIEVTGPMAAFDLTDLAVPTATTESGGFFVVNAVADGAIPDLTTAFMQVVQDAGYDIAGSDDEGFEAEVFFASGQVAAGQVVLTEADCEGMVDVKLTLLDDPAVTPGGGGTDAPSTSPTS